VLSQNNHPVAYKLLLPSTARIHYVFHVSQLKLCQGVNQQSYIPLPLIINDIGPILKPADILQSRIILEGDKHIPQVLVHWKGIDAEHATWEEFTYMQQAYSDFNLEDKVDFDGETMSQVEIAQTQGQLRKWARRRIMKRCQVMQ